VANPDKTTKRGMINIEEVPGVYGDFTDNTCLDPAFGKMERVKTQDPLTIS
jgi:hypothetical protein